LNLSLQIWNRSLNLQENKEMEFVRIVLSQAIDRLNQLPALALLGSRQVGKTTLSRQIQEAVGKDSVYLDLESPSDLAKLADAEGYFLERQDKLIILDEVQRMPELFPILRSVIDRHRKLKGRFLLLGSASPELLAKSSETLAGRIAYLELNPLIFAEVLPSIDYRTLWLRGGYPDMLLAENDQVSFKNRLDFIQTYLERELPLLGLMTSPVLLRNLLRMLMGVHGNVLNYSDLSRSLGLDVNTIKRYIDFFEYSFIIRRLQPYFTNISKRVVKSPKLYFRDSGLLHAFAGISKAEDLEGFLQKGNSWEGFVIQDVIAKLKQEISPYFFRTQDGSELDLVLVKGTMPVLGIEVKYSNAPSPSKGNTIAAQDLGNIPVLIVTPSANEDFSIGPQKTVTSFGRLSIHLEKAGLI